jgi:hypothetical protein
MKKIFIILLLCIVGCETTQTTSRNPKCENIKYFKVFQVLDKFVLATACRDCDNEYFDRTNYCGGHVVSFKKEKEIIYFDDQIIKVKNNECAIYLGTYQYPTSDGYKTVPIVQIIDSKITKPE